MSHEIYETVANIGVLVRSMALRAVPRAARPVRVAEARAQAYVDRVAQGQGYELPPQDWQRRTIALVDIASDRFYCLDLYRISGGAEHWWSFHAQEGEFKTEGLDLVKQEGTLAGPEVPYGDAAWLKSHGCSYGVYGWAGPLFAFPHLYNVQRGKSDGVWSADWRLKTGDGLHLRLTVTGSPGTEVNICDGRSPAGGSPYEMKWIMLHAKDSPPVKTQVLSVLEPYVNEPAIRSVRRLALAGPDEQGFAAAGCEVQLADRTDTLLASADGSISRTAGSFRLAGRFGFYSERQGVPVAISLVGGTQLAKDGCGIAMESPEYRAKIVTVDRDTQTITVSPPPHDVTALLGADIFIRNPDRRIAYRVLEAKAAGDGAQLRLNYDSRIGTGRCIGAADHRVLTSTPMPLQRFRYYHGARLTNAERNVEYRIVDVRSGSAVFLDAKAHADATAAKLAGQFPKESWFDIYDYGVGDELIWPYTASVTLVSPGQYRVTAPVPVQVSLPKGARHGRAAGVSPPGL